MHYDSLPHPDQYPPDIVPAAVAERLPGKRTRRKLPVTSDKRPPIPMAFVFANESDTGADGGQATRLTLPLRSIAVPYTEAIWSAKAFSQLQTLRNLLLEQYKQAQPTSAERLSYQLPHTSLRARLELRDEHTLRLDPTLGLYGSPGAPILWTQTDLQTSQEALNGAVLGWLNEDVVGLKTIANNMPAMHCVDTLKAFARNREAIVMQEKAAHPFQWTISPGGTAKPRDPSRGYAELADYVARQLEGSEVFPGLGGLRRIITGDLRSGQAELMTDFTEVSPPKGSLTRFSLVVRVKVLSFPGRSLPVIEIEFSRRVWATSLKDHAWGDARISGYALPDGASRALRFTLSRNPEEGGHQPEPDYNPIARYYFRGRGAPSVDEMLTAGHSLQGCKLLIGQRHGVAARADVKSGVPDLDKLEAFEHIGDVLRQIRLVPWTGLEPIDTPARAVKDRMQHWAKRESTRERERSLYEAWQREIRQSVQACYNGGIYELVIGIQGSAQADADEARRLLEAYVNNDSSAQDRIIHVRIVPIPEFTHGPRDWLPARDKKRHVRADERAKAWQSFIEIIRRDNAENNRRVDGVLIIAHKWYTRQEQQRKPTKALPDDVVNKRAARIMIARNLGVPVQYLRPQRDKGNEATESSSSVQQALDPRNLAGAYSEGDAAISSAAAALTQQKLPQFHRRLMSAWLMLAFGTKGYVLPHKIQAGIAQTLQQTGRPVSTTLAEQEQRTPLTAPDHVLALSVVRQNSSKLTGTERSFLPCAIELDVATGLCTASFAYEQASTHQLVCTEPLPLAQALVTLAKLGPIELVSDKPQSGAQLRQRMDLLRQRTQEFFNARLADIARRSERPLVLAHANTARSVWPWLTDERLDADNVQIGDLLNAQAAWPHVRLVRVRMDNSPKVLRDKSRAIPATSTDMDTVDNQEQAAEYRTPNWAEAQVYKITDTTVGSHVYLSFGTLLRTTLVRGTSSYRSIQGSKQVRLEGQQKKTRRGATLEPYTRGWSTPIGVEFVVVRSNGEDPDQIASLVEWLRQCYLHIGDWTNKPAPLYFDTMLKKYLADYDLDMEDEESDDESDSDDEGDDESDDES